MTISLLLSLLLSCTILIGTRVNGDMYGDMTAGCKDMFANNYDQYAMSDGYDPDGNSVCTYTSCDAAQMTCPGIAYETSSDIFQCMDMTPPHGSTPCGGNTGGTGEGCKDMLAANHDYSAMIDGSDPDGNSVCVYYSCEDAELTCAGFAYKTSSGLFQCMVMTQPHGSTPCGLNMVPEVLGCMDEMAANHDYSATEAGYDPDGNSVCMYASCDVAQLTCPGLAYKTPRFEVSGLIYCVFEAPLVGSLPCGGTPASDCTGLEEAYKDNCNCEKEYTSSGSLALIIEASDCYGLEEAYKKNCDCEQWTSDTKHE